MGFAFVWALFSLLFTCLFQFFLDCPSGKVYSRPLRLLFLLGLFGWGARPEGWLLRLLQYLHKQQIEPRDVLLVLVSAPFVGLVWYWRNQDKIRELETKEREVKTKEDELATTKLHRQIEQRKLHREELGTLAAELVSEDKNVAVQAYLDLAEYAEGPEEDRVTRKAQNIILVNFYEKIREKDQKNRADLHDAIVSMVFPGVSEKSKEPEYSKEVFETAKKIDVAVFKAITTDFALWIKEYLGSDLSLKLKNEKPAKLQIYFQYFDPDRLPKDRLEAKFHYCSFAGIKFENSLF